MTPTPPVVDVERLTLLRDGRPVVRDLDLAIGPGAIHMLIGPNGAGKSTLLAALLGTIDFAGAIRLHWRGSGRIGWVPQSFVVDKTLPITVLDFLALGRQRVPVALHVTRGTRRRVEALLDRVGLAGFARRPLARLSGGELQRVLIANALEPAPELLLLDEPASGLDTSAVQLLEDELRALRANAAAVLMVSHDLAQVRRLADAVTVLDGGAHRTGAVATLLGDGSPPAAGGHALAGPP